MEITEEAFTRLNTAHRRVLLALNVRELDEDAVKCLANAFDKYANFGRLTNNLRVIITKLSISPKPTQKRLLMRFTQKRSTKPSNTHPPYFHSMPTQPCVIFIKWDA
jgi:hypothetical protein